MIKVDFNALKQHDMLTVHDFANIAKEQGFQLNKRFSTDEHRILVSQDGRFIIHVVRNVAKIYSCSDQKRCLHVIHLKTA